MGESKRKEKRKMKKGIKRERESGTTMAKVERRIVSDYRKAYDSMNEDYKQQSVEFANAALRRINHGEATKTRLLKPGLVEGALISRGAIFHTNFKVKWEDNSDEPVYLLFAQIRLIGDGPTDLTMFVDCCYNLGIFDKLPEEVYDGGCQYCSTLYHPVGGCRKLLRGCVNDDIDWLHRKIIRGHLRPSWYKYVERLRHSGSCSGSCGKQDV
ncbi:hypothetical protein RND81_10G239100 [Saponaria officinalis]|uniref:Uncharacterized protein n=1 Tax=Saponaria officinalis TaxID=3572 RepID=A0AAW1I5N6_SAPOF